MCTTIVWHEPKRLICAVTTDAVGVCVAELRVNATNLVQAYIGYWQAVALASDGE